METIAITLASLAGIALSLYLGQVLPLILPTLWPLLNCKPFNCRPCTTFHLTWLSIGLVAWAADRWWLAVVGVAIAFIVFAVVRYIDKKKIVE